MAQIRKIALFISHIYGDYQRDVCQGVIDKATEYGYHVDVFASNDEQILGSYTSGEYGILQIPNPQAYDGAIISSGTYLLPELGNSVVEFLMGWNCPVVEINTEGTPFPRVQLNNNDPFYDLVYHLHQVHDMDRIVFLGNTNDWFFSNIREGIYREAMTSLNLKSHIKIERADYGAQSISAALDRILPGKPEAIMCYNDEVAFTVMEQLAERGIDIPNDIAVTGCDNIEFGRKIDPSLTSVTFPTYEMGSQAFLLLLKLLDEGSEKCDKPYTVNASIRYGRSCGCKGSKHKASIIHSNQMRSKINSLEYISLQNMHMSSTLQGLNDIDAAMDLLASFLITIKQDHLIMGLKECYICLYSNWDHLANHVRSFSLDEDEENDDRVIMKLGIKNHSKLSECSFPRSDSLPEFIQRDGSSVYVFTSLFFGEHSFGYLCEAFENNVISYPFSFVAFLQNVNSMLQNISDNKNMQMMMKKLEDVYSHDELTGLYNLKKFNELQPAITRSAARKASSITTIVLDLDHLKFINDQYGHAEGNFAIQVIGHAIYQICNDNLIACRFGGDEFYLMGYGYNRSETERILDRIQRYIDNYNDTHTKPYKISVSGGYSICSSYTEDAVNESFKIADRNMYEQKQKKHKLMENTEK